MVTAQRRALVAAALFASVIYSAPALAQADPPNPRKEFHHGPSVGLRLGWGFPFGNRAKVAGATESMGPSANFSGMAPIWLDAGYRINKLVYVGGYFQYGFLFVSKEHGCPAPLTSCHAHDIRGGAGVHFHLMPFHAVDPWLGIGWGYEASSTTFEEQAQSTTRTNGGIEFVNAQVGLDVHPLFGFEWGPFASFSLGEYSTETQTPPFGATETYALQEKTFHYFLVIGMRAQLDF
jgi:hypothetical protein